MEDFVRNRITQLRLNKGLSEYQLSYDLGHSRGYINNITSGKSLPSMSEFFTICDYFNITPIEFFDSRHANPELLSKAIEELHSLDDDDMLLILTLIKRIKKQTT
ncbi:MAG: helix-turn-helix domain-containing protein [Lachnospiraceae bacterium]|nr:helix-turn-helix domain-containing protein [Lachnospiraceae bacterium]